MLLREGYLVPLQQNGLGTKTKVIESSGRRLLQQIPKSFTINMIPVRMTELNTHKFMCLSSSPSLTTL